MMDLPTSLLRAAYHAVPRNPIAGEIYSGAMLARASAAFVARRPNETLRSLMRAWRISPPNRPIGGTSIRWARRLIRQATRDERGELLPLAQNEALRTYAGSPQAERTREKYGAFPLDHRVRLRFPQPPENPERQGDLIILKAPERAEKGVILIKYSETIEYFAAVFQIERLTEEYAVVLEPSWWGYPELRFLLFLGADARVVVQAPVASDRDFISGLVANLRAVDIGPGDWVDPETFMPPPDREKHWDVVFVAAWSRIKRHRVLFRTMRQLRDQGVRLRAALVGYPLELSQTDIEQMAERIGVIDQCTFFENIPHKKVNEVVGRSGVSLVLSKQEGGNKALYESLFAGTPILVPSGHLGVNLDHVGAVGAFFKDDTLADELLRFAREEPVLGVRDWALAHTGALRSTERLNGLLRELAEGSGEAWTRDIVGKKNAPALEYLEEGRFQQFDAHYLALQRYLR